MRSVNNVGRTGTLIPTASGRLRGGNEEAAPIPSAACEVRPTPGREIIGSGFGRSGAGLGAAGFGPAQSQFLDPAWERGFRAVALQVGVDVHPGDHHVAAGGHEGVVALGVELGQDQGRSWRVTPCHLTEVGPRIQASTSSRPWRVTA